MIQDVVDDIKKCIKEATPYRSEEQRLRMYKIINPDIEGYKIFGVKTAVIEKISRDVYNDYNLSFDDAKEVFKILSQFNVEDWKFAASFFLNRYKKYFDDEIPKLFKTHYFPYCHTWSTCDSCCIRVLGPFLAKPHNNDLARNVIDSWASDKIMWIKRASMVILLKIIMVNKEFDKSYVFKKVEDMLKFSNENYIEKGIGWLLKTCSKYDPDIIIEYLIKNKNHFSRLILRYASEKLPKERRKLVLKG